MSLTKLKVVPVLLLTILVAGCSYPFSDDANFVEVKPVAPSPTANVVLTNVPEGDTLLIDQPVQLKYEIYGIDMSLADIVQFKLNGKIYSLGSSIVKGSYVLVPDPGLSGIYTLSMQIVTRSGSGSLADHSGLELIVYEKSWVVRLDT